MPDKPTEIARTLPTRSKQDIMHALFKGAIGTVPLLGAAASEFFVLLTAPPLEQRRDAFMQDVANDVAHLMANRGLTVEDLQHNTAFTDTVLAATKAAIATSQEDKLRVLRNAVRNAALPSAPSADEQAVLMVVLTSYTATHVCMLRVAHWNRRMQDIGRQLANPVNRIGEDTQRRKAELRIDHEHAAQQQREANRAFLALPTHHMEDYVLLQLERDHVCEIFGRASQSRAHQKALSTPFGDALLKFISDPE